LSTAIVLFTRDLRVHDHAALCDAVRTHDTVLPLFVLDDDLTRRAGIPRLTFLVEALADLRASLRARGGDLLVRDGDPVAETLRLAEAHGARTVYVASDVTAYAARRLRRLERARLVVRTHDALAVVPPGALTPADSNHYRVFTPYWRRWREQPTPPVLAAPERVTLPAGVPAGRLPGAAQGGESAGRRRLDSWLADRVDRYAAARNTLADDVTSRLSPYLHLGCLSANEVVARARAVGSVAEEFVRQLCWRDFYLQLFAGNPQLETTDLHPPRTAWREDLEAFERWCTGNTGADVVDAAMRQLRTEGWIANRARLIVAGFLTKTLRLDWRLGAALFAELLIDADVPNNVGNWQWVAGTGVDTRPNRGFSVARQAERFDPDGSYARRYVDARAA
jgi:deoxyribodipyrimidine photo-lyase